MLQHKSVLLDEILSFVPNNEEGRFLDVTAGGGGHFAAVLKSRPKWSGECWDRDPLAKERVNKRIQAEGLTNKITFRKKVFSEAPQEAEQFDYILADIGVSSFQLDDPSRGMSLFSDAAVDFRMDPSSGVDFKSWLATQNERSLQEIFEDYGEEPRAKRLAASMLRWGEESFSSAKILADQIASALGYPRSESRQHPATRAFQALRIAINDELGELRKLLKWAPQHLTEGGRLAIISFHSLEDRFVKNSFRNLASNEDFVILTLKPLIPSEEEILQNSRARSAKLRVLQRGGKLEGV